MYIYTYVVPLPRVFLRPDNLQKGIIGEAHDLVCSIVLSSSVQSVNLNWNFTSNDNRVTVIPTTITTNDSISITYTTVIQFAHLIETDELSYTCTLTIEENSAESIFKLDTISKHDLLIHNYSSCCEYMYIHRSINFYCAYN